MKSRKRKEPGYGVMRHEIAMLADATEEQQRRVFEHATAERLLTLDADFETWAHKNQLPPNGEGWRVWLMMAGRGFGKTRAGAEWIFRLANGKPKVRVALVGATIADARSIMIDGVSGLLSVSRRHRRRLRWEPSLSRLSWPNGSVAELSSGDSANGLRGPEHDFAWCDELAKWREAEEAWVNLQFGLRRGQRPRALVTTTPKPIPTLNRMIEDPWTVTTRGRTSDNINLDQRTVEILTATYGGTRIGLQELDGELLQNVEGALWTREMCTEGSFREGAGESGRGSAAVAAQGRRGGRADRASVGRQARAAGDCFGRGRSNGLAARTAEAGRVELRLPCAGGEELGFTARS